MSSSKSLNKFVELCSLPVAIPFRGLCFYHARLSQVSASDQPSCHFLSYFSLSSCFLTCRPLGPRPLLILLLHVARGLARLLACTLHGRSRAIHNRQGIIAQNGTPTIEVGGMTTRDTSTVGEDAAVVLWTKVRSIPSCLTSCSLTKLAQLAENADGRCLHTSATGMILGRGMVTTTVCHVCSIAPFMAHMCFA